MKRWVVSGYEEGKEFFRTDFGDSGTSEEDIKALMQRLLSKFLTALEIVECTPGNLGRSTALDVRVEESGDKRILTVENARLRFTAFRLASNEMKVVRESKFSPPKTAPWTAF